MAKMIYMQNATQKQVKLNSFFLFKIEENYRDRHINKTNLPAQVNITVPLTDKKQYLHNNAYELFF